MINSLKGYWSPEIHINPIQEKKISRHTSEILAGIAGLLKDIINASQENWSPDRHQNS